MRVSTGIPVVHMPKLVMTDLWHQSRIDPAYWGDLIWCQRYADDLFNLTEAYPRDALDKDLIFLSRHMPPTFASAMLRTRLTRGVAIRRYAERCKRFGIDSTVAG